MTTPEWISLAASAAMVTAVAAAMITERRTAATGATLLQRQGTAHQARWATVALTAAAAAAALHLTHHGPAWANPPVGVAALAAYEVGAARRYVRRAVRAEQSRAQRLLDAHRARRVDVPIDEPARLCHDHGTLTVRYPAIWPKPWRRDRP